MSVGLIKTEPEIKLEEIVSNESIFKNIPFNKTSLKEEKNDYDNIHNISKTDFNQINRSDHDSVKPKIKSKVESIDNNVESNLESNEDDYWESTMNYLNSSKNDCYSPDLIADTFFNNKSASNIKHKLRNKDNKIMESKSNTYKGRKKQFKLEKTDLTCKICNETFLYNKLLVTHMSVHFPNYICHICAKAFTTCQSLKIHLRTTHMSSENVCQICNKKFKCKEYLAAHMTYHNNPDGMNKCPQCPERFSDYHRKVMHLIDVHGDEPKKYKCKLCPKRYYKAGALSAHVRNVHLQERKCICPECDASFFKNTTLKRHMLKHTKTKNFQCDVCHKSYGRKFTLTEHMKIHLNIKKFVCQVCSKSFTQKCTLKGHMKIHPNFKTIDNE